MYTGGCYMKLSRKLVIVSTVIVILLAAAVSIYAAPGMTVTVFANEQYNRFLVMDLGLNGSAKNEVFRVHFNTDNTVTDNYYMSIVVKDEIRNQTLISGNTNSKPYNTGYSGKTFSNTNMTDASNLGGSFTISGGVGSKDLEDKVFATGALPQSVFSITLSLYKSGNSTPVATKTILITINPPYQQPLYPINIAVSKSGLDFRWISNFKNIELHLFTDPNGNKELLAGSILPKTKLGRAQGVDGSDIAGLLEEGGTYYWQLWGYISTSHGDELAKGTLNEFMYSQEGAAGFEQELTEPDKQQIKQELTRILTELFGRKWARSLRNYDIARIVLDQGFISREEVMTILHLIEQKKLEVNNIYIK
jgi:hypothetical protein